MGLAVVVRVCAPEALVRSRPLSDERTYSREEVALVLRRLGELQSQDPGASALTRSEIERVASEAGLDLRHMDTALAELETGTKRDARFAGMRLFVVVRRSVPGTLSPERLEAAVALINRSLGVIGQHQVHGNALTWFGRQIAVSINSEGPTISIQIEERFHNTTRGQLILALGGSMPVGLITVSALAGVVMGPVALALGLVVPTAAYGAVRALHARRIENTEQSLGALGDQLAALLRD